MNRPLSDPEYETLTPADRVLFDDAIQAVPSERSAEFLALMLAIRAIVKHDTASAHNAVRGVFELQDRADEATRELLEAARTFRADTAALTGEIGKLRDDLQTFAQGSTADRADLRRRIARVDRKVWGLALAVGLLVVELVYRYAALLRWVP